MLFNPRYGKIGFLAMPNILVIDVVGPILEVLGYFVIGICFFSGLLNSSAVLAYFSLLIFFGVFCSLLSLCIGESWINRYANTKKYIQILFIAVIENFGYRQFINIIRIVGWYRYT